jgi:predicted porin
VNTAAAPAFGATAANNRTAHSEDWAWRVGAGYELKTPFGATTFMAAVEQLTLGQDDAPAGAVTEFKRLAWQAGLRHRFQNHEIRARYSRAESGDCEIAGVTDCSTDGYGADMWAVGYAYHLSRAAQVFLHATQITNERNAQYTFSIAGPAAFAATPRGAEPRAVGLGMRYAF